MEKKFKKGDRVLCTDSGNYGNITEIDGPDDYGEIWYEVLFDDGEETWLNEEYLELTDVDKKTAFLTELKELLIKYDVTINSYGEDCGHGFGFKFGDDEIWYSNDWIVKTDFTFPITPSNIFDYDSNS